VGDIEARGEGGAWGGLEAVVGPEGLVAVGEADGLEGSGGRAGASPG
jgi:hypothetical protein